MTRLTRHTVETAPEGAKETLAQTEKTFGFAPGLFQVMAGAPQLLQTYNSIHQAFQKTSFNARELTVVWQTINVEHECTYCVPAHTALAGMMNVDPKLSEALRNEAPLNDAKLEALRIFVLLVVRNRGHLTNADLEAFYAAGYGEQQVLEVILGVAQKVISNYTNHIAQTPVDLAFTKFTWTRSSAEAA
ncbi:alkylhydroperoxidase AhpD family core domain-containing protein [Parasphingorhabdus marina DSM 22363]|uniref:Alkylhydroperoxidase AhpD family core domain-containing protein n=1 Tax=Parasphingorhabdus marina DSM 22363 TaxID=1123272 RepID=A0A1N6D8U9_9SPHN|nr:carboxymuconolactone decarboxylase family protein [Parasphingorhabdus marina]SIN67251.1 alkylhydroperoxidase AhpD family core domain-containing protein [Parasphingorhabdus marina DSM 22363]